jgi:DNA-binding transcriptional ArsR family regulator
VKQGRRLPTTSALYELHLRILREAGLVDVERRGTWAYYRLAGGTVAALAAALGGAVRLSRSDSCANMEKRGT